MAQALSERLCPASRTGPFSHNFRRTVIRSDRRPVIDAQGVEIAIDRFMATPFRPRSQWAASGADRPEPSNSAFSGFEDELTATTPTSTRSSRFATMGANGVQWSPSRLKAAWISSPRRLEPEVARALLDLEAPGGGQEAGLAELEVRVRVDLALAEVRGDLQADVILRVLPEEDAGPVIRGVLGRRRPASGMVRPDDLHADLEVAPDLPEDARRVHPADVGAQEVGRAGDDDRGPIVRPIQAGPGNRRRGR